MGYSDQWGAVVASRPATGGAGQRHGLAALLGLLLLAQAAFGWAFDIDPRLARFRHLTSSQGLSQDSVIALLQDGRGFIWLGTQYGLNRFDGYDIKVYQIGDPADGGLASSFINALALDADGVMWVATQGGLHRYLEADDRFQLYREGVGPDGTPSAFEGRAVFDLHLDAGGRLWVGSDAGLSLWQPEVAQFRHWPAAGAAILAEGGVRRIASDGSGQLWLGTVQGLRRFDPVAELAMEPPPGCSLCGHAINAVAVDRDGRVWLGSDDAGVEIWRSRTQDWIRLAPGEPRGLLHARVHRLYESRDGAMWVGTEAGVERIVFGGADIAGQRLFQHHRYDPFGLGRGRVMAFLEDGAGSLWFGTWDGGASRLDRRYSRFSTFTPDRVITAELASPAIQALAVEGNEVWLGSNAGLYRFDGAQLRLQALPATAGLSVVALAIDAERVWIGTGSGLYRFDVRSGMLSSIVLPEAIRTARIRRLAVDGDRLWLHAELHGLYLFESDRLRLLAHHRMASNAAFIQVFDRQRVVVGAAEGLYWFDRREGRPLGRHNLDARQPETALPALPTGFARDAEGKLWLATYGGGLLRMRMDDADDLASYRFIDVTRGRGLANQGINAVLADDLGRLWLATDRGISRFDPRDGSIRNYDADDGAIARGYYFTARGQLDNSWMVFSSKDGFTLFDPYQDEPAATLPTPLLTDLVSRNQVLRPQARQADSPLPKVLHSLSQLSLPAAYSRGFTLRFASPEFVLAGRLGYQYQLQGFDPDWQLAEPGQRQATYTNLPPGRYRFQVRASSHDGSQSAPRELDIELLPAWWQSLPFRLLLLASLVALVVAGYWLALRQMRHRQRWLQAQIDERTTALAQAKQRAERALEELRSTQDELVRSEKMSALGQLVAGVAHEVNTPLGVALTAASHLGGGAREFERKLGGGKVSRTELEHLLATIREGTDLVERNLDRAAQLIRNFKQISVDRSSDGRREFVLGPYLEELLQSLRLLWKHKPVELQLECPADIRLDSFPGALGQVLTNLAQNAVLHAFDHGDQPGQMLLQVRRLDTERIEIRFADDGRGIEPEALQRIFEPFYTTRRNEGGSGLGLHIVYNLVKQKLGGSIDVKSLPGFGTEFFIVLPTVAPA